MVSIIIPMYNANKTIRACLNSILKQTYDEFEVVIIDDGSSDNSGIVCKEYVLQDSRFKYYWFKNHGVSWARNKGIELSKGEFLIFVDSDDTMNKDMVRALMAKSCCADLVVCGINTIDSVTLDLVKKSSLPEGKMSVKQYGEHIRSSRLNHFYGGPYCKLFKRELIDRGNVKFNVGQSLAEDFCFNIDYLLHCKDVYIINDSFYNYYINQKESLFAYNYSGLNYKLFFEQAYFTFEKINILFEQYNIQGPQQLLLQLWKMYICRICREKDLTLNDVRIDLKNKLTGPYNIKSIMREGEMYSFKEKMYAYLLTNKIGLVPVISILRKRYHEE